MAGVAVVMSAAASVSPGQIQATLPDEIVRTQGQLAPGQIDTLRKFIDDTSKGLSDADPIKVAKAKTDLIEPLGKPQVGNGFRLEYGRQLKPSLDKLTADTRPVVAINALVVAGEIGTPEAVAIIDKQVGATELTVRYAAVRALGACLESAARSSSPAILPDALENIVASLSRRMESEKDPIVFGGFARSIAAGLNVTSQNAAGVRARAASELSQKLGARLRDASSFSNELNDTVTVAGTQLRDALLSAGAGANLPPNAQKDVVALGAEILVYVARTVSAGKDLPQGEPDLRPSAMTLASLGQAIAGVGGAPVPSASMGELLKAATAVDDAKYLDGVGALLESLARPPYSLDRKRWKL